MQRAVTDKRLGASGGRAVVRPKHLGQTTIGNHVIRRLIQSGSVSGDLSEFSSSYPPMSELLNDVLGGPSESLDREMRNFMESRFGYDFSQVKLHTDSKAAESAAAVDAKAYTVGDEIVFGAGEFSPGTVEGRRSLAHELTHVVQQAAGPVAGTPTADGSLSISDPDDAFEQAAESTFALHSIPASLPPFQQDAVLGPLLAVGHFGVSKWAVSEYRNHRLRPVVLPPTAL